MSNPGPQEESKLAKWLKDIGCKDWQSVPTDSVELFQQEIPGESPRQRLLAWMRMHCCQRGRWSAYAIDERGRPLTLARLAADLGWTLRWAREIWLQVVKLGLVRNHPDYPARLYLTGKLKRGKDGRFIVRGEALDAETPETPAGGNLNYVESSTSLENGRCTDSSASLFIRFPYLKKALTKLQPSEAEAARRDLAALVEWETRLTNDAMAAARAVIEQREDTIFARHGLARRRLSPEARGRLKAKRGDKPKLLRLEVLIEPDGQINMFPPEKSAAEPAFAVAVQTPEPCAEAASVQSTPYRENRSSVQPPSAAVQTPAAESQPLTGKEDSPDGPGRASKQLEKEEGNTDKTPLSVGRSVVAEPGPTGRPTGGETKDSPHQTQVRAWLQTHVAIPGFQAEESQVRHIAAKIREGHAAQDLDQFGKALARKSPVPNWKYVVKVADSCAELHEHYKEAAAGQTEEPRESDSARRLRERWDRQRAEKERRAKGEG